MPAARRCPVPCSCLSPFVILLLAPTMPFAEATRERAESGVIETQVNVSAEQLRARADATKAKGPTAADYVVEETPGQWDE